MDYVYHGSKTSEIKRMEPRESTHGEKWVYATTSRELAMIMAVHMTDINAMVKGEGTKKNPIVIVERKPGVFKKFLQQGVTVYTLDGADFKPATSWGGEVVSDQPQEVLKEEYIENVFSELEKAKEQGVLEMCPYKDRKKYISADNSDLIPQILRREGKLSTKLNDLGHVVASYPWLIGKVFTQGIEFLTNNKRKQLEAPKEEVRQESIKLQVEKEEQTKEVKPSFEFNKYGSYDHFPSAAALNKWRKEQQRREREMTSRQKQTKDNIGEISE